MASASVRQHQALQEREESRKIKRLRQERDIAAQKDVAMIRGDYGIQEQQLRNQGQMEATRLRETGAKERQTREFVFGAEDRALRKELGRRGLDIRERESDRGFVLDSSRLGETQRSNMATESMARERLGVERDSLTEKARQFDIKRRDTRLKDEIQNVFNRTGEFGDVGSDLDILNRIDRVDRLMAMDPGERAQHIEQQALRENGDLAIKKILSMEGYDRIEYIRNLSPEVQSYIREQIELKKAYSDRRSSDIAYQRYMNGETSF